MKKSDNRLTYVKAGHRFLFIYDHRMASVNRCLVQLLDFVADPELDFDCSDAATVARKLRERHGTIL